LPGVLAAGATMAPPGYVDSTGAYFIDQLPAHPDWSRVPSLTFLLIGWFSPAEEAKRPICSGFLRFRPERKGVDTNRPGKGPTEECEKSVLVEDPGASGCARSGAGLPDEAFRRFARDSSS